MKKLLTTLFSIILLGSFCAAQASQVQMLAAFSQKPESQNVLWVGTFQMVWNEFSDNIVKGPIKFKN